MLRTYLTPEDVFNRWGIECEPDVRGEAAASAGFLERVLFGSRFPDSPMAPQLYNLERSGLEHSALEAICAGNLDRLLYQR